MWPGQLHSLVKLAKYTRNILCQCGCKYCGCQGGKVRVKMCVPRRHAVLCAFSSFRAILRRTRERAKRRVTAGIVRASLAPIHLRCGASCVNSRVIRR